MATATMVALQRVDAGQLWSVCEGIGIGIGDGEAASVELLEVDDGRAHTSPPALWIEVDDGRALTSPPDLWGQEMKATGGRGERLKAELLGPVVELNHMQAQLRELVEASKAEYAEDTSLQGSQDTGKIEEMALVRHDGKVVNDMHQMLLGAVGDLSSKLGATETLLRQLADACETLHTESASLQQQQQQEQRKTQQISQNAMEARQVAEELAGKMDKELRETRGCVGQLQSAWEAHQASTSVYTGDLEEMRKELSTLKADVEGLRARGALAEGEGGRALEASCQGQLDDLLSRVQRAEESQGGARRREPDSELSTTEQIRAIVAEFVAGSRDEILREVQAQTDAAWVDKGGELQRAADAVLTRLESLEVNNLGERVAAVERDLVRVAPVSDTHSAAEAVAIEPREAAGAALGDTLSESLQGLLAAVQQQQQGRPMGSPPVVKAPPVRHRAQALATEGAAPAIAAALRTRPPPPGPRGVLPARLPSPGQEVSDAWAAAAQRAGSPGVRLRSASPHVVRRIPGAYWE